MNGPQTGNALRVGRSGLIGGDLWLRVNQRCNDVCMKAWKDGLTDKEKSISLWRAALRLMTWLKQHHGSSPNAEIADKGSGKEAHE